MQVQKHINKYINRKIYKPPPKQDHSHNLKKLIIVILISLVFIAGQFIGGYISGSISVISDAFHLVTDLIGFIISFIFIYFSRKKPNQIMSFGYHRMQLLGALGNLFIIWALAIFLVYEATVRIINKQFVKQPLAMLIIAAAGLPINIIMYFVLHSGSNHSHGLMGQQCGEQYSTQNNDNNNNSICLEMMCEDIQCLINNQYLQHCHRQIIGQNTTKIHKHKNKVLVQGTKIIRISSNKQMEPIRKEEQKQGSNGKASKNKHHQLSNSQLKQRDRQHGHRSQQEQHNHHHGQNNQHSEQHQHDHHHEQHQHHHHHGQHQHDHHDQQHQTQPNQNNHKNNSKVYNNDEKIIQNKDYHQTIDNGHDNHNHDNHNHNNENGHNHHDHDHDHQHHHHESMSMRAAVLHALSDIIQSIGLLISALVIFFFGSHFGHQVTTWNNWHYFDPITTYIFSIIVIISTWPITKNCYYIIMQSTPSFYQIKQLTQQLSSVQGVIDVHDLHIWDLRPGKTILISHVFSKRGEERNVLKKLTDISRRKKIFHSTFQVEEEEWKNHQEYILCEHDIH